MDRVGGDRCGRSNKRQHSVHKNTAQCIAQTAHTGRHSSAQNRGGLLPGQSPELKPKENVFFAEVCQKNCKRNIIADACGNAHFQGIPVEKQNGCQIHHNI